ncbi:MAG: DUF4174 domain-containing protein [Verrucomicrobiota bacterium]
MKTLTLALLAAFTLASAHAEVVRPAPNFTWGTGRTLKSWQGQPVVLIIAPSPRSGAFRKQAQRIQAAYQELAARNVVFVAAFTDPEAAAEKIPSNVPFVIANNGTQIATNYGLEGNFALAVIGRDGNLDLNSPKVIPASRIMDMVINNAEQQTAERKP